MNLKIVFWPPAFFGGIDASILNQNPIFEVHIKNVLLSVLCPLYFPDIRDDA